MKQTLLGDHSNDELYTPSYAVEPLLKYLPEGTKIWECTDFGESEVTKVLKENGHEVISTHLKNFDFLKDTPNFEWDVIVTNPPYSLKDEFLEKAYFYGKPFAMLLPITTLEGIKRGGLFRANGIEVLVLDRRINFMKNGKRNWFNTSWFCWKLLDHELTFEELDQNIQTRLF